jgi:hypothetical protein
MYPGECSRMATLTEYTKLLKNIAVCSVLWFCVPWRYRASVAFSLPRLILCDTTLQNDVSLSGNGLRTRRGWRRASGAYLYVLIS